MSNMTAVKLNPDIYIKDLRQIYITSNPTLSVNTAACGEPSDGRGRPLGTRTSSKLIIDLSKIRAFRNILLLPILPLQNGKGALSDPTLDV